MTPLACLLLGLWTTRDLLNPLLLPPPPPPPPPPDKKPKKDAKKDTKKEKSPPTKASKPQSQASTDVEIAELDNKWSERFNRLEALIMAKSFEPTCSAM